MISRLVTRFTFTFHVTVMGVSLSFLAPARSVAQETHLNSANALSLTPSTSQAVVPGKLRLLRQEDINRQAVLREDGRVVGKATFQQKQKFGFGVELEGISAGREDPNGIYVRQNPFPEVHVVGAPSLLSMQSSPGLEAVESLRRRWLWPSPDGEHLYETSSKKVWRWNVPDEHRTDWPLINDDSRNDRYHVVVLVSSKRPHHEPIVCLFDASSSARPLVWQAELPLRSMSLAYRTVSPTGDVAANQGVSIEPTPLIYPAVTCDGGRVLVCVGSYSLNATLIFTYDGKDGKLLDTNILRDLRPSLSLMSIKRAPTADYFLLNLEWGKIRTGNHDPVGPVEGSYLLNGDGEIVGRFLNDAREPIKVSALSDTHAVANETMGTEKQEDGQAKNIARVYYALPTPKVAVSAAPKVMTSPLPAVAAPHATQPVGPRRLDPPLQPQTAPPHR